MVVSGQRHAPAVLYPQGKDLKYPLDRRVGGPHNGVKGGLDKEGREKILWLCRVLNPGRPGCSQALLPMALQPTLSLVLLCIKVS
jgi:hypothetical protein